MNVNTGGDIVLNGTKIENNKAYTGAYYTQATVSADGDKWSINTDNSTLHPNTSFVGKGGGLQLDFATCTLNAGSISDNYADKYGGGSSLSMERVNYNENFKYCKTVKFTVNGGEVLRNSTAGHGGAAYLGKNIFNTMTLEEFMNKVFDRGNGQPSGPTEEEIVLFQSLQNTKPTYTATGGTISHNTANGDGGAVYIETGNAVISGGSMSDNSASMNGGAVYISGDVTMTGGQVTDNTATNGGGVYVTDGNFTMISGTMTDNKAIERTSGQAEAGNEGYGGAILVNDGMLIIGLENCDGYGENGSIHDHNGTNVPSEYADLDHPVLQSNVAAFGGGIAVKGGNAYIYCGQIDGNTSNSPGTGMNIFMDGGELYQDYDATIIGSPKDQGVVNVGGKLTIGHGNGALSIDIVYHSNYSVDLLWKGVAPDGYYLNLPYCPKGWSDDQKEKALVFVGWSQDKNYDAQTVRAKDDYHPIGYPFEIKDMDGDDNDTKTIHFYAIWAPFVNKIAYQYCYDGENVLAMEDTMKPNGAPQSYQFELSPGSIDVASPSKAGYTFVGWMLYASTDDIANWDADPVVYPATLKTHLPERTTIAQTSLLFMPTNGTTSIPTEQNFGVITLVAIFTPAYTSLTVTKVVDENNTGSDENQTFLFRIVGTPDDGGAKIDMTIAIVGAGSVTIEHLPVGTYTITEITDWSWRYDTVKAADDSNAQATVSNVIVMELKDPELTYTCKFINTRTEEKWLSGDSILRNWWGNLTATNTEGG